MEVTKALIKRFFENSCTPEEANRVHQYLLEHKDELDQWLPDEEWEAFEAITPLNPEQSNRWYAHIESEKVKKQTALIRQPWLGLLAAALAAGIFLGIYLFGPTPVRTTKALTTIPAAPARQAKTFHNSSDTIISYVLDDGSVVALHANSTMVCPQPFDTAARHITLQGEALFRVAKDKNRPFTVFTKGFSTTALGTTFRIAAYDSSETATVKLLEGKVVLRNLQQQDRCIYLKPGDECRFLQGAYQFQRVEQKKAQAPKIVVPVQVDGGITESTTEIHFSNTPLADVLKKVGIVYKIAIDTDNIKLAGRTFTGSFLKKQAVDDVLGTIAGLNNITIKYDGKVYRLSN